MILVSDLAAELGIDRSNLQKFIKKNGIETARMRTRGTRNQSALALTPEAADEVRRLREGFTMDGLPSPPVNGWGEFYVVQIAPDLDPRRVKLGYTTNMDGRLASYRTIVPTALVVQVWPCKLSWEQAAIDCVTKGYPALGGEVFECPDVQSLLDRCTEFFGMMP